MQMPKFDVDCRCRMPKPCRFWMQKDLDAYANSECRSHTDFRCRQMQNVMKLPNNAKITVAEHVIGNRITVH